MEETISKEELNELLKIKGELRGNGPKTVGNFILKKEGEEGLKKLEEVLAKVGYLIEYSKIKTMGYYPLAFTSVPLLVAKRLFNFSDKDFQEMGKSDVKFSTIQKIFIKYYVSLKRVVKEAPKMWEKYHTSGELKIIEHDEKKKNIILRIENFKLAGLHCQYLIGYFTAVFELTTKGAKASCEETKCPGRGDEYHEFLIKW